MKNKISCYINFYNDLDFLNSILDHIDKFIDEIVIVDGPYLYCVDTLKKFNLYYDENSLPQELQKIIKIYGEKIKYYYNIWNNEKEKRMFGYDKCTNDIVMLLDSDEFYYIDEQKLNEFIESNYNVGGFKIYNMNRTNLYYEYADKFIIFKKKIINSHQHLSYTWLVGVDGLEEKDFRMISLNYIGIIYHQTLNRTKYYNSIKYIFYISLYNSLNNTNNFLGFNLEDILKIIKLDDFLEIFSKSKIELINIPQNKILKHIDTYIDLEPYNNNHKHGYFTKKMKVINDLQMYFYLDENLITNNEINICIKTNNIKNIEINLIEISLDKAYFYHNKVELEVKDNYVIYNKEVVNKNNIYYVLNVKCKTIENTLLGMIEDIFITLKSINITNVVPFGEECYTCKTIDKKFNNTAIKRIGYPFDYVGHVYIEKIHSKILNCSPLKHSDLNYRKFDRDDNQYFLLDDKYKFLYWHDITHENENFPDDKIDDFLNKYNNRYERLLKILNSNETVAIITVQHFDFIYDCKNRINEVKSLYNYLRELNKNIYLISFNYSETNFIYENLVHINISYDRTTDFNVSKNNFIKKLFEYVNLIL